MTIRYGLLCAFASLWFLTYVDAQRKPFTVVEATIPEMQKAMREKRVTSREIVQQYLTRIALYESKLHATITVNPNALKEAEQLDRERAQGKLRGPLHGIPIALKDIIHTTDMPTTGGALAFDGFIPPYEATLTKNLRDAGAVIIAKTSLTELANWVAGAPTPMPTNYNAISGHGMNPYDPRRDLREASDGRAVLFAGGSSSGIGTAANLWAANVGTETSGSILTPSNAMMLVGIKPTVGRISRYGVIPITADQDTPGPMAKTVADAAILLGVLESKSPDPNDPATNRCTPPRNRDYTPSLKRDGLKGARIGIPRASLYENLTPERVKAMQEVIDVLKREGAIVTDPADVPSMIDPDPQKNFGRWSICSGTVASKGNDANCSVVLKYGMKRDFNRWLATLGPTAPVKSLTELREWNLKHERAGAIKYGQSNLDISDEMDVDTDRARYEADRAKDIELSATHGIDEVMKSNRLDALLFPGSSGAALAARPGYPSISLPFALVPNAGPFPEGFDPKPGPFGVSFTGMACSEPRLIELGYSFEQATKRRIPPPLP
ncbi:MAG TPA: amidase family protein [Terriglobia bacterium]|nr:amidase family protein [Terriglobia bacterium]